jgi:hypothetical protein
MAEPKTHTWTCRAPTLAAHFADHTAVTYDPQPPGWSPLHNGWAH